MVVMKWYPRLTSEHKDGLLHWCIPTQDSIIICHQGPEYRKFTMFNYYHMFANHILKDDPENRCYFEIIQGNMSQKPYFDIDIDIDDNSDIDETKALTLVYSIKESILYDSRIKDTDILIFSSHGEGKLSFHIIIDKWCLPDYSSNKSYCLKIINRVVNPYKKYIDLLVYTPGRQFRTFGSTKRGKKRVKILIGQNELNIKDPNYRFEFTNSLMKSLITNTKSCRILEYEPIIKKTMYFSGVLGELESLSVDEIKIIELLEFIKDGTFSIQEIKGRLISLKRNKQSYCEVCKREHQNENPYLIFGKNEIIFHCRRTINDKVVIWSNNSFITTNSDSSSIDEKSKNKIKASLFMKKFLGKK